MHVGECRPDWRRCPLCGDVLHGHCLTGYIIRCGDTFACPNCKGSFRSDDVNLNDDEWSADDIIDRLLVSEDVDYVPDRPVRDLSQKRKRHLRSQGSPPAIKRRLRSDGDVNDY